MGDLDNFLEQPNFVNTKMGQSKGMCATKIV